MNKIFLNISFSILSGIFILFCLSFTGFIFGFKIMPLYSVISFFSTLLIFGISLHIQKFPPLKNILCSFLLFCLIISLIIFSGHYIDPSWDGKTYHQTAVLFLENGWNPIYQNISDIAAQNYPFKIKNLIWCENYVKFSEIIAANIFAVTHKIETGKAFTPISLVAAFCYVFYVLTLKPFSKITQKMRFLFSFILIYNPVLLSQFLTYYIDGLLYLYMLIATFSIIHINICAKEKEKTFIPSLFFIISSVILMNIKLGGVLYFICILLGIFIICQINKIKPIVQMPKSAKKTFLLSSLIIVLLTLLSGINPYFTNISKQRHPLYPLVGKNKIDIMTPNTPKRIIHKSKIQRFFISIFAKADCSFGDGAITYKIPFTFYKSELKLYRWEGLHIAGFGPLFSGIFVLGILLFFTTLFKNRKNNEIYAKDEFILLFLILILSILLNPENWWARYIPQLWGIFVLFAIFSYLNKIKENIIISFLCIMFINSLFINYVHFKRANKFTRAVKTEFEATKQISNFHIVIPSKGIEEFSRLQKYKEAGINYSIHLETEE